MLEIFPKFLDFYSKEKKQSHVAFLLSGKKIISIGCNDYNHHSLNGKRISSLHAEIKCLNYFFKNHSKIKKDKYKLIVINVNSSGNLKNSSPCYYCAKELLKKGFTKVYFSTNDGKIVKKKIVDLPFHISESQKIVMNNRIKSMC